jgi:glycosyltransferase involved in cell wall biosynthesis
LTVAVARPSDIQSTVVQPSQTSGQTVAAAPGRPSSSLRVLVIIPAFNEQGNVGPVVKSVRERLPGARALVVDDGSSDATADEAAGAGAAVLRLPVNLGYGAALQAGYKYAVRQGFDVVAQIDADGQHRPEYLGKLLDLLATGSCDVVIGSRFLDRDGHYSASRARKVGMAVFGRIASLITRQHVSDPTSGFQVMDIDVARFFCSDIYPADYPDADILILLHRSGFRVAEVGVEMRPPAGKSMHSGHRSFYYVYKMSLSIVMTLLRTGFRAQR